jgi:predicted transcriptional regulator
MATPKHTKTEREAVLAQVAELDRKGWTQAQIAERLQVSQPQVSYDLKVIRKRYQQQQMGERAGLVNEKLAQLGDLQAELWEAWERSKEDATRTVEEHVRPGQKRRKDDKKTVPDEDINGHCNADGASHGHDSLCEPEGRDLFGEPPLKKVKETRTVERRLGDANYLRLILECWKEEAKLLGLYPDETLNVKGQMTTTNIDWDQIVREVSSKPHDKVERRIAELLQQGQEQVLEPGRLPCGLVELPRGEPACQLVQQVNGVGNTPSRNGEGHE